MYLRWSLVTFLLISTSVVAQSCIGADFVGSAKGGDAFQQPLGNGLMLHLNPLRGKRGWEIVVSPQDRISDDWAYPVNPPLRFGNSQYMGTGYGESVKQKLMYPHEVRFLLTNADYSRLSKLAQDALWPSQSPQPENAATAYLAALKSVATGTVVLTPIDYDRSGSPETVEWMKFKVAVTVPTGFLGAKDLRWKPVTCGVTQ